MLSLMAERCDDTLISDHTSDHQTYMGRRRRQRVLPRIGHESGPCSSRDMRHLCRIRKFGVVIQDHGGEERGKTVGCVIIYLLHFLYTIQVAYPTDSNRLTT